MVYMRETREDVCVSRKRMAIGTAIRRARWHFAWQSIRGIRGGVRAARARVGAAAGPRPRR